MRTPRPLECLGHGHRDREPKEELDRDVDDRERDRHPERVAGDRIEDDLLEIPQPDKGVAGNLEVIVDEENPDREQQRIDRYGENQQSRGRDEQPFETHVAAPRRREPPSWQDRKSCCLSQGCSPSRPGRLRVPFQVHQNVRPLRSRTASCFGGPPRNAAALSGLELNRHAELFHRVVGSGARQLEELLDRRPSATPGRGCSVVTSHSAAAVFSASIGSVPAHTAVHMRSSDSCTPALPA